MHSSPHTYRHPITANAVDLEAGCLEAVLKQADCDPLGHDLCGLAQHRLVEEIIADLGEHGVVVRKKDWTPRPDGGVDLVIEFSDDVGVVLAKMRLG